MLTIKHVEEDGHEGIMQCERVSFVPDGPDGLRALFAFGCVPANSDAIRDGTAIFGSGVAYVMNAAGATVAKYHLCQAA